MWPNPHQTADLVTFTAGIINGKLYFFVENFENLLYLDNKARSSYRFKTWMTLNATTKLGYVFAVIRYQSEFV